MKRIFLILALIFMIVLPVFGQTGNYTTNEFFYLPEYGAYGTDEYDEYNTYMQKADTQIEANKNPFSNVVLCSDYDHPDDAITAISTDNKTLVVTETEIVDVNFTVPANVTVKFERGGKWTINNGVTVTFNGSIDAGLWQIFAYVGTGTLAGTPQVKEVYPQWWGALGDDTNDDTDAIQSAIDFFNSVFIIKGTYKITSALTLSSNKKVSGQNRDLTIIHTSDNTINGFELAQTAISVEISDLKILAYSVGASNTAIKMHATNGGALQTYQRLRLGSFAYGIHATNIWWNNTVRDVIIDSCKYSIYVNGTTNLMNLFTTVYSNNPSVCGVYLMNSDQFTFINCNFGGISTEATESKFLYVYSGTVTFTGCNFETIRVKETLYEGAVEIGGDSRVVFTNCKLHGLYMNPGGDGGYGYALHLSTSSIVILNNMAIGDLQADVRACAAINDSQLYTLNSSITAPNPNYSSKRHYDLSTPEKKAVKTIADGDATPDISLGDVFITSSNTGATEITDFDNPTVGQVITLIGGSDTNPSTITNGGNFSLWDDWTANLDESIILFVAADNDYVELTRRTATGAGAGDMLKATYDSDEDDEIDVAGGGTEKSSWTQYVIPYLSGTTTFGEIPIGTAEYALTVNAGANGYDWTLFDLSLYYLKTAIDSQGEIEAIWGVSLANDSELHNVLTLGTASGLSLSTQVLSLAVADTNTTGALNDTDWDTFNDKIGTEVDPTVDTDAEIKAILVDEVTKTGDFTGGRMAIINNASGIIEQGTNTDTDVADAVTKRHSANADTDLDATFEATFAKKADKLDVFAATTSSELADVISDEIGTGKLRFDTSVTTFSSTDSISVGQAGLILVSAGSAYTLYLPTASGNIGLTYKFVKTDYNYNLITLDGDGGETLNYENSTGSPNQTYLRLNTPLAGVTIVSDGTNWQVINEAMGQVPKARVYLDTERKDLVHNEWVIVPFNTESYNIGSNYNMATWVSGTADGDVADHLQDDGAGQFTFGMEGYLVINTTAEPNEYAWITQYNDAGDVTLSADIFPNGNEDYTIKYNKYVVPVAGKYEYFGVVETDANSLVINKKYTIAVYKNGTGINYFNNMPSAIVAFGISLADTQSFSKDDYIEFKYRHKAEVDTVDLVGVSAVTYFTIKLISKD